MKVTQHPLMEIIARKLSGIEGVPRSAQTRMVLAACHAARIYHDAEIERLRARVAELEAVRPTRCPRDFDATPRDYTGKTDGMSAELEAEVDGYNKAAAMTLNCSSNPRRTRNDYT